MKEQAVGLGNRRGSETRGRVSVVELQGVRLDALIRFQVWGDDPDQLEAAITDLHLRLLGRRNNLRLEGFLHLSLVGMSLVEHLPVINAWRKQAEYEVLYEYQYEGTDGAESLIARIPVEIGEVFGESTLVTDKMLRWDENEAALLDLRGDTRHPFRVGLLSILAFLPEDWDGEGLTVSASLGGLFREKIFASIRAFLEAFTLKPESIELGGNAYTTGSLTFPNVDFPDPILLLGGTDFFRIRYGASESETFDSNAIVYLRVLKA